MILTRNNPTKINEEHLKLSRISYEGSKASLNILIAAINVMWKLSF